MQWSDGYQVRFGLVKVNFGTMERTPKASAYAYKVRQGHHHVVSKMVGRMSGLVGGHVPRG